MIHSMTKKQIFNKALQLRNDGKLYDRSDEDQESGFKGSIDRFCWIAYEVRDKKRVLDIGSGGGLLLSLLYELGHECYAVDFVDNRKRFPDIFFEKKIDFKLCNMEADPIPFPDNFFDAVFCCQALEHFTHSHLPAVKEMYRVLKPGGILEVDVPNAVCFRNRWRMIRGKHITWDYEKHYLREEPIRYKEMTFFPDRHNREFTLKELQVLLEAAGFDNIRAYHLKSRRYRTGIKKIRSLGSMLRDSIPSFRKSLIAFAVK